MGRNEEKVSGGWEMQGKEGKEGREGRERREGREGRGRKREKNNPEGGHLP